MAGYDDDDAYNRTQVIGTAFTLSVVCLLGSFVILSSTF